MLRPQLNANVMPTSMDSTHRPFTSPRLAKALLWIDCVGGLTVGVLVLTLSSWLSALYGMPERFVIALGVANLAYGAFSLSLARRAVRPRALLQLLIGANLAWALFCVIASALLASQASAYGLALLLFEGAYVGGLGHLEWRFLDSLQTKG
jgi:hypothetical protein